MYGCCLFTVGAGVTVWGCTDNIDSNDRKRIKTVLDSFGKTVSDELQSVLINQVHCTFLNHQRTNRFS
jgi:pyrroline-5-carboxylate reductase